MPRVTLTATAIREAAMRSKLQGPAQGDELGERLKAARRANVLHAAIFRRRARVLVLPGGRGGLACASFQP
jgi:hypothetical protein